MCHSLFAATRAAIRRFAASSRGNVAMMFALTAAPLIVAGGGVVDYSRATLAHSEMQDALDATSLALAREVDVGTMTASQMQQFAKNYFTANFSNSDAQGLVVTPSYSVKGPSVTIRAAATVPSIFLGLIGIQSMPVSVASTTVWGRERLRVALVLDNTGSMADAGKMAALKTASHKLLGQLETAASQNGDVYVSIIPFSKDVNGGAASYQQSWIRWDLWDEINGTCSKARFTTKTSCTGAGKTWTVANHNTWNGCLTDRDQNYDTTNVAPVVGSAGTLFPAEQYGKCPADLIGLSYDWAGLNKAVDSMQPNGNTNQAIGLQWGWQSLSNPPLTVPPLDPAYKYKQVIILLTDGLNTEDRWYRSQSSIDDREQIACDNVKRAGVLVYTVQVDTGGDPTSALLQNCATDLSDFFLLTSADQIVTTFESIGTALSDLRVSS